MTLLLYVMIKYNNDYFIEQENKHRRKNMKKLALEKDLMEIERLLELDPDIDAKNKFAESAIRDYAKIVKLSK